MWHLVIKLVLGLRVCSRVGVVHTHTHTHTAAREQPPIDRAMSLAQKGALHIQGARSAGT